MPSITISNELHSSIKEYCKLNNLKMVDFINSLLSKNFIVELYGEQPSIMNTKTPIKNEEITPTLSLELKEDDLKEVVAPIENKEETLPNIGEVILPLITEEEEVIATIQEAPTPKTKKRRLN